MQIGVMVPIFEKKKINLEKSKKIRTFLSKVVTSRKPNKSGIWFHRDKTREFDRQTWKTISD